VANQPIKPKRILIVDDEATLVFFLKQGFQEANSNYRVDVAPSGEDALTKLTYNQYDLLITDLKMPGISGFTLVEVARSLHPHIKIILMTAFGSKDVLNEAKNLQVDGYITKPFATAKLQAMANSILNGESNNNQDLFTSHSMTLDKEAKESQSIM